MWPFGKKVACFQCDRKVKEKHALRRRGFHLCSPDCESAFLVANKFPRPPGDDEQLREELGNRLVAALGELGRIPGAPNPLTGNATAARRYRYNPNRGELGAAMGAAMAHNQAEEAEDAVVQFNSHATEALPYLAALELTAAFELLDTMDLEVIRRAAKRLKFGPIAELQTKLVSVHDGL